MGGQREAEGPVEVENEGLVEAGQEAVVGLWRIGRPERCPTKKTRAKSVDVRKHEGWLG